MSGYDCMDWFRTLKRDRRRKRKKKPVPNIFQGEKVPDEERIEQQKKEKRKGNPWRRTGLPGRGIHERIKILDEHKESQHHKTQHVEPKLGGTKRPVFYGKEGGVSRTSTPKSRCSMCSKRISPNSRWMRADRSSRMRYCKRCMKGLGGPIGFIKDVEVRGKSRDQLNSIAQKRRRGE